MRLNFKFRNGTNIRLDFGVETIIGGLLGQAQAAPAPRPKRRKKARRRAQAAIAAAKDESSTTVELS
jgi:hypothetical protein